jgi:hypothetical protein
LRRPIHLRNCFKTWIFICMLLSRYFLLELFEDSQPKYEMKMTSFRDIAPCSLVEVGRRFRGAYCFNHLALIMDAVPIKRRFTTTRLHSAMSHNTFIFLLAAVRPWILTKCEIFVFKECIWSISTGKERKADLWKELTEHHGDKLSPLGFYKQVYRYSHFMPLHHVPLHRLYRSHPAGNLLAQITTWDSTVLWEEENSRKNTAALGTALFHY